MPAWFIWMPGTKGPQPQIAFDELDTATSKRALVIHPLSPENEQRARLGRSVNEMARRYPRPKGDEQT